MNTEHWVKAAAKEDFSQGKILCREFGGKKILITKSDGSIFACGATCPHQGVSMENGIVFDCEITCTEHSWTFSLLTGELTFPGSGPRIPIYPIRISAEGDIEVLVE